MMSLPDVPNLRTCCRRLRKAHRVLAPRMYTHLASEIVTRGSVVSCVRRMSSLFPYHSPGVRTLGCGSSPSRQHVSTLQFGYSMCPPHSASHAALAQCAPANVQLGIPTPTRSGESPRKAPRRGDRDGSGAGDDPCDHSGCRFLLGQSIVNTVVLIATAAAAFFSSGQPG